MDASTSASSNEAEAFISTLPRWLNNIDVENAAAEEPGEELNGFKTRVRTG